MTVTRRGITLLALGAVTIGCAPISGSSDLYRELTAYARREQALPVFFAAQSILEPEVLLPHDAPFRQRSFARCRSAGYVSIDGAMFVCWGGGSSLDDPEKVFTQTSIIAMSGKVLHQLRLPLDWQDAAPVPGGDVVYFLGVYPKEQPGARFGLYRWEKASPATVRWLGDPRQTPGVTGQRINCNPCMSANAAGDVLVQAAESIVVYRAASGQFELFGEGAGAVWSPDGRRIAFRTRANKAAVREVETGATGVLSDTLIRYRPAWSPDSSYLAYSLDSSSTVEFHRLRDGAKVRVSVGGILKPQGPNNLAWIVLRD